MKPHLESDYLGLKLKNPLIAAASPLSASLDGLRQLEDAELGAITLPSLFEEQLEHEELETQRLLDFGAENSAEVMGYFPEMQDYRTGPDEYLELIRGAKRSLSIPVIGSLNGFSSGGWVRYASLIEEAGADALELNVYFVATDPESTSEDVERRYVELVEQVRGSISVPLTVKIGPYFSSLAHMAGRLDYAGADGLVLFNRFLQPDLDLDEMKIVPHLSLSRPEEMLLAFRWIAILRDQVGVSLAATGGAHDHLDVVKLLLAGADAVAVATTLLRKGPRHAKAILSGLEAWLSEHDYHSVEQLKGSYSQVNCPDPEAFERANYMKALTSFTSEWV